MSTLEQTQNIEHPFASAPPATRLDIQAGWLQGVQHIASPNFNQRPTATVPRLIVLHNISLPPAQFGGGYIQDFFQNRLDSTLHPYFQSIKDLKVSAHLLILRSGQIIQFVSFDERAWHAGRSSYLAVPECNDYSIGIELEGTDDQRFTEAQYASVVTAILAIQQCYPATRYHLTGHSDIAPGRKTDPGEHLDWQRIRRALATCHR